LRMTVRSPSSQKDNRRKGSSNMSEWFYHVAKLANHHLSANSLPYAQPCALSDRDRQSSTGLCILLMAFVDKMSETRS
jgi:hypothetical protein